MTDKTPAMHELPEPDRTMWQHGKQIDHYTADQMRAYALATLQAQPAAAVSDEEIWGLWDSQERTGLVGGPCPVKFARAILALRPQSESDARRAAQEQLYTERERHTAEVKRLQAEIGRLQSLRPQAVPMTGKQARLLSREELAGCCGGCASNSAIETWMRRAIEKFCEVNGITAQGAQEGV